MASDSIHFAWCPDGEHILTALWAPRLHFSMGTRFGIILALTQIQYVIKCRMMASLDGLFPAKTVAYQAVSTEVPSEET